MRLYVYIVRRIILAIISMFGASLVVFYLMRNVLTPSYWLAGYIGPKQTAAEKLQIAQMLGFATKSCPSFDDYTHYVHGCIVPWFEQYVPWLKTVIIGSSPQGGNEWAQFPILLPYTIQLVIISLIIAVLVAVLLAIRSAAYRNSLFDRISRPVAIGISSIPSFIIAIYLILLFGFNPIKYNGHLLHPIFPISGASITECAICYSSIGSIHSYTGFSLIDSLLSGNFPYFWDSMLGIVLPSTTLILLFIAPLFRHTRSAIAGALKEDYILLARSKGIRERTILFRHALRNSIPPIATVTTMLVPIMINNVIVIEFIFGLHGIGQLYIQTLYYLDASLAADILLVIVAFVAIVNLAVDISYGIIDPRIRSSK